MIELQKSETHRTEVVVRCEACGGEMRHDAAIERAIGKPPEQQLWICQACGHRQVDPVPDLATIDSYYSYSPEEIKRHNIKHDWTAGIDRLAPTYERRLRWVRERVADGARLLDVGYGNGIFLKSARQMGFNVTGIDPDPRYFKPDFPCELKQAHLSRDVFAAESFDVVSAHHVLEHVADLADSLTAVNVLLRPGGYLIIELPQEVNSLIKRLRRALLGGGYTYRSIFQHLRYFTPRSLSSALERHGFEVEFCRTIAGSEFWRFPKKAALLPISPLEWSLDAGIFLEAVARKRAA